MQIETAERRRVQNELRQDHAIGDNHGGVRLVRTKLVQRFRALQRRRSNHGYAEPSRLLLHRRWLQFHAAPGGFWRAGIDGGDLMAMRHQLKQRRHRELRRAHEDQSERHGANSGAFPPPLRGRVRERGKPEAPDWRYPPSPPLPRKGGESRPAEVRYSSLQLIPPRAWQPWQISSARGRASAWIG